VDLLSAKAIENIRLGILEPLQKNMYTGVSENISAMLEALYARIPDNRRISCGRVYTVKLLCRHIHEALTRAGAPVFSVASGLWERCADVRARGVCLGLLSHHGLRDLRSVLPYFEDAASSSEWDLREFAQMFFRKLIKPHPGDAKRFLMRLAGSADPRLRRFVSETLRPVRENRWFYGKPDYPLTILKLLFAESAPYPRSSVGNNLSDLARRLPELVYDLVKDLVASGNRSSYWIATRACRNLVKREPLRVMDILGVDEYRYKKEVYRRIDYQGN